MRVIYKETEKGIPSLSVNPECIEDSKVIKSMVEWLTKLESRKLPAFGWFGNRAPTFILCDSEGAPLDLGY